MSFSVFLEFRIELSRDNLVGHSESGRIEKMFEAREARRVTMRFNESWVWNRLSLRSYKYCSSNY